MTVSTELSHEEYVGNGVTTDFGFRFRIFESKHLIVVVADSEGNETTLKNGTDYTIVGAGSYHGGKVVLNKPLAQDWKILLERDLPVVQETDLRNQGKFFAEVHEDAFDYLTMLIQKALGTFSLSLRKPTYLSNYYDAKGNRIANLAPPKFGSDSANKDYVDNSIKNIDGKTLRVKDKPIPALPSAEQRRNKQLGFDNEGYPQLLDPAETGSLGYIFVDSFEKGAEITTRYQALHFEGNGEYYRWDGELPKTVLASSTPDNTGGIGNGAWISVGNASLRKEITSDGGVNIIKGALHGAVSTDKNIGFKQLIDAGEIYQYEPLVNGLIEGFSIYLDSLYLTRNGISYKYVSEHNTLIWPSQYINKNIDTKSSIESIMQYGLNVDLNGTKINASSINITMDLSNGEIVAINDVGSFITVNSCKLQNVKINCNRKAIRRPVHIKNDTVRPAINDIYIFESVGASLVDGIFVDANSVRDFSITDVTIRNMETIGNGIQGDGEGPCRGIRIGSALDPQPESNDEVSSGVVNGVYIQNLRPWEDADGVVIQIYNSSSKMMDGSKIKITNIYTHNALKRAVKIQANNVDVSNIYAICDDATADNPMYSVVSVYGGGCFIRNVSGKGRIGNCVDSSNGLNTISDIYLKSTATYELSAGLHVISGQVYASNIHSEGSRYIVSIRAIDNDTPYVDINGVSGQGYDGAFLFEVRYGHNIGKVCINDISVTSSSVSRSAFYFDILNNGFVGTLIINNVKRLSQKFNGADIQIPGGVQKAIIRNATFDSGSSSIGVSMTTGNLTAENIFVSGKQYAVNANQTDSSFINNINGIVRLINTKSTRLGLYKGMLLEGENTDLYTVRYS